MLQKEKVTLIGAPPSPYTRKMIALLRYRHIPYEIIWGNPGELLAGEGPYADLNIEPPKPVLLPTFLMRDDKGNLKTVTDSTPIIRRLEDEFEGRSVIPEDPALNFLNYLLEDFGDEWVTKYMFHYRWHFEEDADNASSILPLIIRSTFPKKHGNYLKRELVIDRSRGFGLLGQTILQHPLLKIVINDS